MERTTKCSGMTNPAYAIRSLRGGGGAGTAKVFCSEDERSPADMWSGVSQRLWKSHSG